MTLLTKRIAGAIAGFAAVAMVSVPAHALERLTVGTPPAGLVYNQIGTTISTLYQEKTGTPSTARPFGGTTAYMPLLQRGEIDAGIHGALESRDAYLGQGNFPQAMSDVRALLMVTQVGFQFFTAGDAGLKSIDELKGKRVINEYRALQGFGNVIDSILASGGINKDNIEPVAVGGVGDGIRSITEGRADAAITALAIPPLREADAAMPGGITMLTLGEDEDAVNNVPGLVVKTVKPSPAQVGVKEPIRVAHMNVFLNSSTHLTDDEAYELVKVVHENWAEVQEAVPAVRGFSADSMVPEFVSHPFHPGAVKYFREVGLWTDAHQAQQDELLK